MPPTDGVLRVGNMSGFYGDRAAAMAEMLAGADLDVLTGDYLAELTMLILARDRAKDPSTGYARTFLAQLEGTLATAAARRVKIVANAGGLNPAGPADAVRALAARLGVEVSADGTAVITKPAGTGGAVTVGTVTAQLLYEIDGPRYAGPDVTARFDTIRLEDDGTDRVRITGVRGEPPPPTVKVGVSRIGGFRNEVTFVLPVAPPTVPAPPPAPTRRAPLGAAVGARSGDKGGSANIGVWARTDPGFAWLVAFLDADRLRALLPEVAGLPVRRAVLPNLRAVNFVVDGLLGEGVAYNARHDPQAKALGEWLRSRVVDIPEALLP